MSGKSERVARLLASLQGRRWDAHYLGFFACFNQGLFFEAHEVLEELWLGERGRPRDLFYKGLIQLAGAFVHVQKNRPAPAISLFKLAQSNLARYPDFFEGLEIKAVQTCITRWLGLLASNPVFTCSLVSEHPPRLELGTAGEACSRD